MTRINASIQPAELCDKHLTGEIYELPRIMTNIRKKMQKGQKVNVDKLPKRFKLGAGHVIFFYDKLQYLHNRYIALIAEATIRNFNVEYNPDIFADPPDYLYNNWQPQQSDRECIVNRLNERMLSFKNLRKYKQLVDYKSIEIPLKYNGRIIY